MVGAAVPLTGHKKSFPEIADRLQALRPPSQGFQIAHRRVKSLESPLPQEMSAPRAVEGSPSTQAATVNDSYAASASTPTIVDALQRELDRMRLVYGELLSAMDAEITRLSSLLEKAGVDCDGNPLPADEAAELSVEGVYA